jgi:hypothetical protein
MADEQVTQEAPKEEAVVTQVEETQQVTEPEYSPAEALAKSRGWQPKEDWESNPNNTGKKWRDAEEFLERGELFDKIHSLNRESTQTKQALNQLASHHKRVYESAYNKAIRDLKSQRAVAIKEGDGDMMNEVEDRMAEVTQQYQKDVQVLEAQAVQEQPQVNPQFVAWVGQNEWFVSQPEARAYAEIEGIKYARSNPSISNTDVWNHVAKKVREKFPEYFPRNPNKERAPDVEGSGTVQRPTGRKGGSGDYSLTPDEEKVMNNFVRSGVMTKEEYIKELKSIKG